MTLFSRIPFRTLAFPWSPWRAGSPKRKSLPNGKRSRSSWWDWRKLRRKANPDTHTGHRPGQGSLIDARHYYWVPVRIISFVVLTHGATVNNPPPPQPIVCNRMQEFEVKEKVNIFQIGDFGNLWQTILIWMWCTFRNWGFVCATLYYIPFLNKFHSTLMQSKNTIFWKAPVHTCIFSVLFSIFFL